MVGPSKLEGPDALEVLAFQEDRRAGDLVQAARGEDRRHMGHAVQNLRSRLDIRKVNREHDKRLRGKR